MTRFLEFKAAAIQAMPVYFDIESTMPPKTAAIASPDDHQEQRKRSRAMECCFIFDRLDSDQAAIAAIRP
jgi:hypothetical protein